MKHYVCTICKIEKPETDFYVRKDRKKGRIGRCKLCEVKRATAVKDRWLEDPENRIAGRERDKRRNKVRYDEAKEIRDTAKNRPCMDCGKSYPPYVMDFDHRDPSTKKFVIGLINAGSRKRMLDEIQKCDVVCSNCHRERTHRRKHGLPLTG